jgi:hypothetical protein
MNKKQSLSFRCPVHQSPAAIAHSFNYEPYISLKIDGIFTKIDKDKYSKYYPIFPEYWTKIEGELYENKILYIFYIETDLGFSNLQEMYEEIKKYFYDSISNQISLETSDNILDDIKINIESSLNWLDINSEINYLWFPKKYWKLDTTSWNSYIDQLNLIYNFVEDELITNLIKHDGLVISPNIPSHKKSLIKLKPKKDLTIDLFYNGKTFLSINKTDYKNIITKYKYSDYEFRAIYRLEPTKTGLYKPIYKREPGKKANPDNIIQDILYKHDNYFDILQLKDLYESPWYGDFNESGLDEVLPLLQYTQNIYNDIIKDMNDGNILDIGCGSMGQYYKLLNNNKLINYVGLDLDLSKLHEAQVKVSYDQRFKFVLFDICHKWNKQNSRFSNNLWSHYFLNMIKSLNKFNNIISVFSSQYANVDKSTWDNYVQEINTRSISGTKIFIMFIDSDKIKNESKYYKYDIETNRLTINLPHRKTHIEPGLSEKQIIESFNNWSVINKHSSNNIYETLEINQYIELINFVVLIKN